MAEKVDVNKALDINKDGVITIKELGPRITSKMKEFGIIEKPIEKSSSDNSNIVLPPQIVQGSNQTVNDGGGCHSLASGLTKREAYQWLRAAIEGIYLKNKLYLNGGL